MVHTPFGTYIRTGAADAASRRAMPTTAAELAPPGATVPEPLTARTCPAVIVALAVSSLVDDEWSVAAGECRGGRPFQMLR